MSSAVLCDPSKQKRFTGLLFERIFQAPYTSLLGNC